MKIVFCIAIVTLALGIFLFAIYSDENSIRGLLRTHETLTAPTAPVQKNVTWEKYKENYRKDPFETILPKVDDADGGIFIRHQDNLKEDLLVKFGNPQELYRYDAATEKIVSISESEWQVGKNEISCRERESTSRSLIQTDEKKVTVYVWKGGQQIPTFGRFAMDVLESPKHNLAVILSSDGYRTGNSPGLIFGGQGGETFGNRFVRILNLSTMEYITPPLSLVAVNNPPTYRFCWTDDEKYVLAYELDHKNTKFGKSDNQRFDLDFHVIKASDTREK